MKELGIDVETFSRVDLPACGVHKYVEDAEFQILLFGYSVDGGPVQVVDFASGAELPPEIYDALWNSSVLKTAYNAQFERQAIGRWFGRPCDPEQWECSMVLAASCGLPLRLEQVGPALGLPEDRVKMPEGKALIRYFCNPCRPTRANGQRTRNLPEHAPDKWAKFIAYNRRDVEVEQIVRRMLKQWRPDDIEHRIWCLDQRINDRGVRVDTELVSRAISIGDTYRNKLFAQAAKISGLDNPNSTQQVKDWLLEQEGVTVPSLNKKVVADVVASLNSEDCKRFLELRSEFSKSSTKKYEAMQRSTCDDGHIHGCFQFAGAGRTGRWAGRLVQLQNLPQNHLPDLEAARELARLGDEPSFELLYPNVNSTLSELIRTALVPEPGHRFMVADYSAIEARVVAWLAGEEWVLDEFRGDGLIYEATAAQMFHVPKNDIRKGGPRSDLRPKGKVAQLACGYGGGVNALKAFGADRMGMTEEEMAETVALWRESNPRICALWRSLEQAAIRCVARKQATFSRVGSIRFEYEGGVMWMVLPSGRRVAYFGAKVSRNIRDDRLHLTYFGLNQTTRKWESQETWGGKLTENLVQATARDCLRDALLALDEAGYDIRAHVHDEIIVTEPLDGRSVEDMCGIMGRTPVWAPGLPLRADGFTAPFYRKDD